MRPRSILFVLGTALLAVVVLRPVVSMAIGQPGSPALENGDTNGDGLRDLSDAVYLLNWLFLGGDPPETIPCDEPSGARLPATGQTSCYDGSGNEIPCGDPSIPGQDADHGAGCDGEPDGRFVVRASTVVDRCTGLEWQRVAAGVSGVPWTDALQYADAVILAADGTWVIGAAAAEEHGGVVADDWRLPNVREAESVIDYGRADPAVADMFEFDPAGYWTSTTSAAGTSHGWCISFFDGDTQPIPKVANLKIVVVRDSGG